MEVFNLKFVAEVEKYPQLYNYTLSEYSKRDATEKAWHQVATEMKMSVSESKEKWRNLRSTFGKNLKPRPSGSGTTKKKPYYLMEAMQFAVPFIKVAGNPCGSLPEKVEPSSPTSETEDVLEERTEDFPTEITSPETSPGTSQQDQETPGPINKGTRGPHGHPIRKRKLGGTSGDAESAFSDYFAAKQARLNAKASCGREEGIKHFLLSLMPELINFNDMQLRKFKKKTLELIEEVIENPTVHLVKLQP